MFVSTDRGAAVEHVGIGDDSVKLAFAAENATLLAIEVVVVTSNLLVFVDCKSLLGELGYFYQLGCSSID